jgi:transcriptional regulator with GAF, ATPase, and Fis domain
VRVIAATNRDLGGRAAAGEFRPDLYYRLNVFPVTVPALRERREDIPLLVAHFLAKAARKLGKSFDGVSPLFLERATAYDWPGNVRELENVVERAAILARGPVLESVEPFGTQAPVAARPEARPSSPAPSTTLEDVERAHIERVLGEVHWVIEGERGAAHVLGLNASTLRGRMRKLGIRKPRS